MIQTSITKEIAALIRQDARSGRMSVKDIQNRYKLCQATVYDILAKRGKYANDSAEPIRVKSLMLERDKSAALFMHNFLGFNRTVTSHFLGKYSTWYYVKVGQLSVEDIKHSVAIPVAVKEKFFDVEGNELQPGFYRVSYVDSQNAWAVRMTNKAMGGRLVPISELSRRCQLVEGAQYE